MHEILTNIYHWTTYHEGIQDTVHSYYVEKKRIAYVIDPRIPKQGLQWFKKHRPPNHVYLTNRLHYRHSFDFIKEFGSEVWCQEKGLFHFKKYQEVKGFKDKERLPGAVIAININVLCPEETVLFIPESGGILSIADAIIRVNDKLMFVPNALLGNDPEKVKEGIKKQFRKLLRRQFKHIFFAHGEPVINHGREILEDFIK